jgi:hypothetical protein
VTEDLWDNPTTVTGTFGNAGVFSYGKSPVEKSKIAEMTVVFN